MTTQPFLGSEDVLDSFLRDWETGTLPKEYFTHAAHVAVCAYYAFDHDPAALLTRMRDGIRAYNVAVGGANTDTAGYHETLTRFWCSTVVDLLREAPCSTRFDAVRAAVAAFGHQSGLYRSRWTHDIVKDPVARREWVPPDQ